MTTTDTTIRPTDTQQFSDGVERRLAALLQGAPAGRSVAVFDADGTLWADDIGEDFLRWLIAERKLLNVDYEADLYAEYEARCDESKEAGYGSLGPIMAGIPERDLQAWAAEYFAAHYADRVFSAQTSLIERLHQAGWEVWIVSASTRWIVQAGSPALGVSPERVVGINVEVEDGVLTDRQIEPITCHAGKVAAIEAYIGVRPRLVAGNSMGDYDMLAYASDLALVIEPGPELDRRATEAGWMIERW